MSAHSSPPAEDVRAAMAATNRLFNDEVFGKKNFAVLDEVYTAEARILPPGAPMISGREAIRKFWAEFIPASGAKSAVLESIDVIPAADGVVEIGKATLTIESSEHAETQAEVKYVVYWRSEDGKWKWHVDIWNMNS